ncbi:MAG TPA: response regulator [Nitrososphaeraceae archaeon]|nr:response regulator [Nitrososphaeraceae archaeon]
MLIFFSRSDITINNDQNIDVSVTSRISSFNHKKKKILFVDDEHDMTLIFKKALESSGFSVDAFNDSERALMNFKPRFYDLVVLDIVMPKVEGFDLYKVCFLTASEKFREDLRGREYQMLSRDLFIRKPMSIKNLIKEIQKRTEQR